jgi:hypothetical protein
MYPGKRRDLSLVCAVSTSLRDKKILFVANRGKIATTSRRFASDRDDFATISQYFATI